MVILRGLILKTPKLDSMKEFYTALGFDFAQSQVKIGSTIFKAKMGATEFSLIGNNSSPHPIPAYSLSFEVKNINEAIAKIKSISTVVLDPQEIEGKITAMVLDPDGHSVELYQIQSN